MTPEFIAWLTVVPMKRLGELNRAAEFAPGQTRCGCTDGAVLHYAGRTGEATMMVNENLVRHPNDRSFVRHRGRPAQ
ncbi:MAG: hypothetical protein JO283_05310 [Bradyrhizobium sp.]|nr:hypothetical protein [Bradyrhizobium sp.]